MAIADHGLDTIVAGLRCRDVLADLSDYLDGALGAERVAAIQRHLAGCDRCARFGTGVGGILEALRAGLAAPPAVPSATASRLRARLADEMQRAG
jgi:anti-sigma factor RsiW